MRRPARTGRLIVKGTSDVPPSPRVKPTRRQAEKLEEGSQRDAGTRLIDGPQDPLLVVTIG